MSTRAGKRPSPPFLRVVLEMIALTSRAAPVSFALYLASSIAFTGLLFANLHFIRVLVERLPRFADGTFPYGEILAIVLLYGGANLLIGLTNGAANFFGEYAQKRTAGGMAALMHEKAGRIDPICFESAGLHDDIDNAAVGRDRGFDAMEKVVFSIIFHGGYFLSLGLYLAAVQWRIVLALGASFLPVAFSHWIRASSWYTAMSSTASLRRELSRYEDHLVDRRYCKETRTLGAGGFLRSLYDRTLEAYNRAMWRAETRVGLVDLGLKVLTLLGYLGVLWLLLRSLQDGSIDTGIFAAVFFTMTQFFKHFDGILERLGSALQDASLAGLYFSYLDLPERRGSSTGVRHDAGVVLSDVTFRYPGDSHPAVDSISLDIRPGETLAIVGGNGAGKSTLVKLVCGLLLPQEGSVCLGGVDSRRAAPRALYAGTSAVFQAFQRYRLTLAENVIAGEAGSPRDDERIRSTLSRAGIPEGSVPGGLHAMLAPEYDGVELSSGQWQKVAIARGLFRNHDLIVLDEPTSAIDPLAETELYRLFIEATRGRTALLVTHRLGSTRIADRIVVMDGGRLVEEGTHASLLDAGGWYAQLWRAQAKWYERD